MSYVSLNSLIGQNGIVTQTVVAKETHTKESIRESLNLELTGILTDQISNDEETSREISYERFGDLKEFGNLKVLGNLDYNMTIKTESNGYTRYLIVVDEKYVYEIKEKENGDQEIVYWGEENRLTPTISDITLAIKNSTLQININSRHSIKYDFEYTYEGNGEHSTDEKGSIAIGTSSKAINFDLKKVNVDDLYGAFTLYITAYNIDNEKAEDFRVINVSKLTFNADKDGANDDDVAVFKDGSEQYIAYIETDNDVNTVIDKELPGVNKRHWKFDNWYINDSVLSSEEKTYCNENYLSIYANWEEIGHRWDETILKDSTCTEDGSENRVCKECGREEFNVAIAAKGHDVIDVEYTIDKQPTCTETGSKSIHCKRCDAKTSPIEIAKIDHDYRYSKTITSATCTSGGSEQRKCTMCGNTKTFSTSKLGHSCYSWTEHPSSSCTSKGYKSGTCTRCGTTLYEDMPAGGHNYGYVAHGKSTCSYECKNCGDVRYTLDHNWNVNPPDWYKDYLGRWCRYCTRCDYYIYK